MDRGMVSKKTIQKSTWCDSMVSKKNDSTILTQTHTHTHKHTRVLPNNCSLRPIIRPATCMRLMLQSCLLLRRVGHTQPYRQRSKRNDNVLEEVLPTLHASALAQTLAHHWLKLKHWLKHKLIGFNK